MADGAVKFTTKQNNRTYVSVVPHAAAEMAPAE
jgi:ribosomal protein L27